MKRSLTHSLLLILFIGLTFYWTYHPRLSSFNLQLTGSVIILYFTIRLFSRREHSLMALDAIVSTVTTILIVENTGGLDSPIFFLFYFLLFGLSLLFEPLQAAVVSLTLALILSVTASFQLSVPSLVNLLTLLLITPLATVFGRIYLDKTQAEKKIAEEESETLLWLATKAKPTFVNLLDTTSLIISSHLLPTRLHEKLTSIHNDLIALHQSASILEHEIDTPTES